MPKSVLSKRNVSKRANCVTMSFLQVNYVNYRRTQWDDYVF